MMKLSYILALRKSHAAPGAVPQGGAQSGRAPRRRLIIIQYISLCTEWLLAAIDIRFASSTSKVFLSYHHHRQFISTA